MLVLVLLGGWGEGGDGRRLSYPYSLGMVSAKGILVGGGGVRDGLFLVVVRGCVMMVEIWGERRVDVL